MNRPGQLSSPVAGAASGELRQAPNEPTPLAACIGALVASWPPAQRADRRALVRLDSPASRAVLEALERLEEREGAA